MITLSIGLGNPGTDTDATADQQIVVSHFKFQNVPVEQAREGFRHCPGIVIVMPRPEHESVSVNDDHLVLPPGATLLLNGESRNAIIPDTISEPGRDRLPSYGVIEINATINDSYRLRDRLKLPQQLNNHDSALLADIYHDLIYGERATELSPDGSDVSMHLAAARIISLILNSTDQSKEERPGAKAGAQLDRLRQYLLANLSKKITTEAMAEHVGLTRTHFCKRAKSLLGEAPMSYLRKMRLERSLELLEHTAESIDAIAFQVGYADRFSFSKEFTRHYGLSPVQYRKRSGTTLRDDARAKAKVLFDDRRYEQALAVCERALRKADAAADIDPIVYLQGRCLFALGRSDEALAAWNLLEYGEFAWLAGMQRCRLYFQNNHFEQALEELGKLWSKADGLQHNDVIQTWIDQKQALARQHKWQALREYLEFRKKHFVSDQRSKMPAVYACRSIGANMQILEHCLDDKGVRVRALQSAGEYERILDLYGAQTEQADIARVCVEAGYYDKVLSLSPEVPGHGTRALVQLGRPEEAIRRFPNECLVAYLALEEYQKILDHSPTPCFERIYALHALGHADELKAFDRTGSWLWHLAQLYLRPEYLLKLDYPESPQWIPAAKLLLALQTDNTEDALEHLKAIPRIGSGDFWLEGHESVRLLLAHVIPALLGADDHLTDTLNVIKKELRYFDKQKLFYYAAYLTGEIDLETWRHQPFQYDVGTRETFVQALHHDLDGEREEALEAYHTYVGDTTIYGMEKLVPHRFAEWRLRMLR